MSDLRSKIEKVIGEKLNFPLHAHGGGVEIAEIDEKFSVKKLHETEIGGRGELFKKINSLYESVVFGDDSFGDFSVYFDDWMSEEEADELEKEKRDSFSLNMKINPPEKWEKQKESVLKELGIGKFL